MLSFNEILAVKEKYKATEEYLKYATGICIVPLRYIEARYGVKKEPLDELCFLVYLKKKPDLPLPSDHKEVFVFYDLNGPLLLNV